jgi:hypothetical protein
VARHDVHDLERRLRDERSEPDTRFLQRVAATVRDRRHSTPRPSLSLAFALIDGAPHEHDRARRRRRCQERDHVVDLSGSLGGGRLRREAPQEPQP